MMKEQIKKVTTWWENLSERKKQIVKIIIAMMIWIFAVGFFVLHKEYYYGTDNTGQQSLLKKKLLLYFACFIIYTGCLFVKNPFGKAGNKVLNVHIMEWYPLICFLLIETVFETNFFQFKFYKFLLNVLLYMLVMYLFYAITCSVKAAMIGVAAFTSLFGIANVYLIRFRQIPLLASDFTVIKTAMNVAGDFEYRLDVDVILLIEFLIATICIACKLKTEKPRIITRIGVAALYVCFFVGMFQVTVNSNQLAKMKININTFRPIKSYHINGGLLAFTRSIRLMIVDKPDGYGSEAVAKITGQYESDSVSDTSFKKPNVIVIMNEAFSDLQSVGHFETNEEVLPFYKSMKENTTKGFAYVSVFGGQTANSEFEFLTGDSKAFLPKGSTPYQLYIKEYLPSLTGNMKIDKYQGILAMHPFNASGYNRVSVYENLGFSKFITREDFEDPTLVRAFISDQSDYDRIIEEYENAKKESDAPFYLFNVTMQNHSSYDMDYDNLPDTIQITTPECQNAAAQRYLNLIHLSDAATKNLISYFEKQEDPTVIVMFGDHEPGLSDSFYESIMGKSLDTLTSEENMELYKVPFFIWTNYDSQEQYIEKTSLNYLQSLMLDVAGMKKTGYNKYLLDMSKEIPAINVSGYFTKEGTYYDIEDETSPYYNKLQEYNILEYNHLFDKKRQNSFFELRGTK